jgi:hypothetical protein
MLLTIKHSKSIKIIAVIMSLVATAHCSAKSFKNKWFPVSGTGIHYFSTSTGHSEEATETGLVKRSTDIIELFGDINGKVLYHVTSEINFVEQTLTNTGHQVFSGTIMGSNPVLILDDDFEFNVNLTNGETIGKVFLTHRLAGQKIKCFLTVTGTGMDENGDGLAVYEGKCKKKGYRRGERED